MQMVSPKQCMVKKSKPKLNQSYTLNKQLQQLIMTKIYLDLQLQFMIQLVRSKTTNDQENKWANDRLTLEKVNSQSFNLHFNPGDLKSFK